MIIIHHTHASSLKTNRKRKIFHQNQQRTWKKITASTHRLLKTKQATTTTAFGRAQLERDLRHTEGILLRVNFSPLPPHTHTHIFLCLFSQRLQTFFTYFSMPQIYKLFQDSFLLLLLPQPTQPHCNALAAERKPFVKGTREFRLLPCLSFFLQMMIFSSLPASLYGTDSLKCSLARKAKIYGPFFSLSWHY
jgi:hypothetical protein